MILCEWDASEGHPGQSCVHLYARILSTSFTSVSIFSVCCYSIVSISVLCPHNLARDDYIESTCCCVQARFLGMETKAAVVDSSLQLNIFAQTRGMESPFKLPSQCKTCSTAPFLKLIWARWQLGQYSSLEALCSVLPQPLYSMSPSGMKRRRKRMVSTLQSTKIDLHCTYQPRQH